MTPTDLRTRRDALGFTQQQLADALGVHKSTVSHWEHGVQAIPPYVALALDTLVARQVASIVNEEDALPDAVRSFGLTA